MNTWLSLYLYYNKPWESLLVNAIKKISTDLLNNGPISQFFFVRYRDDSKGDHIRWRLNVSGSHNLNVVSDTVSNYFSSYFRKFPSGGSDIIEVVPYEPEIKRYGGPKAILIAEEHFFQSSKIVLSIIDKHLSDWTYEISLGKALQLHLIFAHALKLNREQLHAYFTVCFHNGLTHPFFLTKDRSEFLNEFNSRLKLQTDVLLPQLRNLWHGLDTGSEFDDEDLNTWVNNTIATTDDITDCQQRGELSSPIKYSVDSAQQAIYDRWNIYQSMMHMTNNRLGIYNHDEPYLAYILKESIKLL
jgi:thiopeptide-type bacteriocin biosynthesis protein